VEEGATRYTLFGFVIGGCHQCCSRYIERGFDTAWPSSFALLYLIIINGWMLYTHHLKTGFEDGTFCMP
jgi:hypothetical protein